MNASSASNAPTRSAKRASKSGIVMLPAGRAVAFTQCICTFAVTTLTCSAQRTFCTAPSTALPVAFSTSRVNARPSVG